VDFRNTIVVMTSNIGSEHILDIAGDNSRYEDIRKRVLKALRSHFRPEFLNRVDDLILFQRGLLFRSIWRMITSGFRAKPQKHSRSLQKMPLTKSKLSQPYKQKCRSVG
jgi:ATP-dependent Clp protease ATP-binding subunit ClpB